MVQLDLRGCAPSISLPGGERDRMDASVAEHVHVAGAVAERGPNPDARPQPRRMADERAHAAARPNPASRIPARAAG